MSVYHNAQPQQQYTQQPHTQYQQPQQMYQQPHTQYQQPQQMYQQPHTQYQPQQQQYAPQPQLPMPMDLNTYQQHESFMLGLVIETLLMKVQQFVNTSQAYANFGNALADNSYQNDFFAQQVRILTHYALTIQRTQNMDNPSAAYAAVEDAFEPMVGNMVINVFPETKNYLTPEGVHISQQNAQKLQGIIQFIQQPPQQAQYAQQQPMYGQQPQQGYDLQQGGGPSMIGGPFGSTMQGGVVRGNQHRAVQSNALQNMFSTGGSSPKPHNPSQVQGGRFARKSYRANTQHQQQPQAAPQQPYTPQPQQPQPQPTQSHVPGRPTFQRSSPVMEEMSPDGNYQDYRTPQERTVDMNNRTPQTPPPRPTSPMNQGLTIEDIGERTLDYIKTHLDGVGDVEMVPIHLSEWKHNDFSQTHPIAYNPDVGCKFHARYENGRVREEVMPMRDDMDYLRNELDLTYRVKGSASTHTVPKEPEWDQVEKVGTFPIDEEEISDLKHSPTPVEIPKSFFADSLQAAEFERDRFFLDNELDGDLQKKTHEFTYVETHAFLDMQPQVGSDSTLAEALAILGATNDTSIDDFHQSFVALKERIDSRVWHFINDRCTQQVNDVLANNMGSELLDWSIADFANDYLKIEGGLEEVFGEDQGGAMFEAFERFARKYVIMGGLRVLVGEELDSYIEHKGLGLHKTKIDKDRLLVLGEKNSVTQVEWNISDFPELFNEITAVSVLESKRPSLYRALSAVSKRTRKHGDVNRHYVRTVDNTTLAVERGVYNDRHIVMRIVNNV